MKDHLATYGYIPKQAIIIAALSSIKVLWIRYLDKFQVMEAR
jgi:hypothetical protein